MVKNRNELIFEQLQQRIKNELLPKLIEESGDKVGQLVVDDIKANLARGTSPVEGEGRFMSYAQSYIHAMDRNLALVKHGKKQRPVNMKLSGKMINSLRYIITAFSKSQIIIEFQDPKAYYHTVDGINRNAIEVRQSKTIAGTKFSPTKTKMNVKRKLLPQGNENFSKTLLNKIRNILSDGIKAATADIVKDIKL